MIFIVISLPYCGYKCGYSKSQVLLHLKALSSWSIMASFMLYVVDKFAWDFSMENANF